MKIIIQSALLLICLSYFNVKAEETTAENDISFGVGVGALYSGLGVNINKVDDGEMWYGSTGCVADVISGTICGVGFGWVTTNYWDVADDKHGLGLYLGVIDGGSTINNNGGFDKDPYYGAALGYHYFMNGIDKAGMTFGATVTYADKKDSWKDDVSFMLQIGYQF